VFDRSSPREGGAELFIEPLHELLDYAVSQSAVDSSGSGRPFGRSRQGRPLRPLPIETNRERISRDGTLYPAQHAIGPSHGGHRWALATGGSTIEVAIPWDS